MGTRPIKINKVSEFPTSGESNAIYLKKIGNYIVATVTNLAGNQFRLFDQELVDARIAANSSSAGDLQFQAGGSIGGHRFVVLDSNGKLQHADPTDLSHANRVIGITTESGVLNQLISVRPVGSITESSWNWNQGDDIFVGASGVPTTNPNPGGFAFTQRIGYAVSPTTLFLQLSEAIILDQ